MKQIFFTLFILPLVTSVSAQNDSKAFRAYLENKEFDIYLRINFYEKNIVIPGQEYYGELPGYLGKLHNPFCWVIVDAQMKDEREATLSIINDYGSEDLTATLSRENDSIYTLRQGQGNSIRIPRDRKWFKLPRNIEFKRRK